MSTPTEDLQPLRQLDLGGSSLDIDYYLTKDYADIGQAAELLPAIIEHVNERLQELVEQRLIAKQKIKHEEAKAFMTLRGGRFASLYSGKMTDITLGHAVHLEEDVLRAHETFAVLTGWVTRLNNTIISLQLKLDMVRSTEATRRELMTHEQDGD